MGRQFCGIDISDRTIEIVSMVNRSQGPKVVMATRAELPSGLVDRGIIQDPATLGAVLGDYLDRIFGSRRRVTAGISIPEVQVYSRTVEVPSSIEPELVQEAILDEVAGLMPIDVETSEISIREIGGEEGRRRFFCAAVERKVLEEYQATLHAAGVEVQFMEMESSALARSVVGTDNPVMMVDMGARTTLVTVVGRDFRLSANPMIGGDSLTRALEEKLQISYVKAEQMKRREGLDPNRGDGRAMLILQKPLAEITEELERTVKFFEEKSPEPVSEVILVGGTSMVPGMASFIQDNFKEKKVYQGQPFMGLVMGEFPNSIKVIDQHVFYATAVGLALRSCGAVEDESVDFRLDPSAGSGIKSIINKLLQAVKLPTMPTKSTKKGVGSKTPKKRATSAKRKVAAKTTKRKTVGKTGEAHAVKDESLKSTEELLSQAPPEVAEALRADRQIAAAPSSGMPEGYGMPATEDDEPPLPPVVPHELPAIDDGGTKMDGGVAPRDAAADETVEEVEGLKAAAGSEAGEQPTIAVTEPDEEPAVEQDDALDEAPVLGGSAAGDQADEKDYGLGIGDILSQQDGSAELKPAEISDEDMESPDDGVHRLKIEEILGHVKPSEQEPPAIAAAAPTRVARRTRRGSNLKLVALVVILFVVAAVSVFMVVSKYGLWFGGDTGGETPMAADVVEPAPPTVPDSVATSMLLATEEAENLSGRAPIISRVIETDVSGSVEFEATGEVDVPAADGEPVPATGTITVINNAERTFTFVKVTRFLSEDGTLFRLKATTVIPEGESQVEVYADVAGSSGNIAPTTFTIPGLSADLQKLVTGRSDSFMSGGSDGESSGEKAVGVSQEDLDAAKEKLSAELMAEAKSNFGVMLAEGEVVHDDLISGSDLEVEAPAVGTAGEKFTMKLSQRYRVFLIPESDVLASLEAALPEGGDPLGRSVGKPVYVVEAYDATAGAVELRVEAPLISE